MKTVDRLVAVSLYRAIHETDSLLVGLLLAKKCGRFLCSENIAILYLPMTRNGRILSVSPNRTEITKLVLNINTSTCLCTVFQNKSERRKIKKKMSEKRNIFCFIGRLGRSVNELHSPLVL